MNSIPGSGRSQGEGNGNPLQYSCLEKSHGQRSLEGYSPWDGKESDTIYRLSNNNNKLPLRHFIPDPAGEVVLAGRPTVQVGSFWINKYLLPHSRNGYSKRLRALSNIIPQCFLDGSSVKNLPAMWETQEMWIRSLGGEDPLEGKTATHSSIPAWEIPRIEEPGGLQSMGSQELDTIEQLSTHAWVF